MKFLAPLDTIEKQNPLFSGRWLFIMSYVRSLFLSILQNVRFLRANGGEGALPMSFVSGIGSFARRIAGTVSSGVAVVALCFSLFLVVCVNLANVFDLSLWFALIAFALAAVSTAAVRVVSGTRAALFRCLSVISVLALFAVAVALAFPAWQIIASGASHSWAGRLAPLFASALALYAAALWLAAASGSRSGNSRILSGLFTGPGLHLSLVAALVLCSGFLLGLEWWSEGPRGGDAVSQRFLERGVIPPITVLLFFWGLLLLLGKAWNTWTLRRMLERDSPFTIPEEAAGDVDEFIKMLWQSLEESYLIPRYIAWAVPVLGFIGTVLGISLAADGIRRILSSASGLSGMSGELGGAIAPLGIAFDTTLVALSLSVVLMLALTLVQRSEEGALAALEIRLRKDARNR